MSPEIQLELQHLLSALCDREISEVEFARLEELLSADAACRQMYMDYLDMHAKLLLAPQLGNNAPVGQLPSAPVTVGPLSTAKAQDRSRHWVRDNFRQAVLVLGTLAASVLVQIFWLHSTPEKRTPDAPVPKTGQFALEKKPIYVATLIQTVNCEWEGAESLQNGTRLSPGNLRITKGVASIRFDSGPELVLEGPAILELESSSAATLRSGKVVFRNADSEIPFDLRTPMSKLMDISTEFAVSVSTAGEEVHVFEGEVQRVLNESTDDQAEHLKAGEARLFERRADATGKPAKLDSRRFVRHVVDSTRPAPDPATGLLAYEGFAYSHPFALQAGKANGGIGWAGPWKNSPARPSGKTDPTRGRLNIKESLVRPGSATACIGGSYDYAGFARSFRRLATPVHMDQNGVYYVSFLFRRHGSQADPINTVALRFWTDEDYQQQDVHEFRKRLNIGVKGSNQLYAQLQRMNAHTSIPLSNASTYLLVAKIAASRSKPDQVFLRVYDPEESIEPTETGDWSVQSAPFRSDLVFQWIEIHINSKTRQTIDEIRLGTSWSSVTAPWLRTK